MSGYRPDAGTSSCPIGQISKVCYTQLYEFDCLFIIGGQTGAGVHIYVLDTGVQTNHPEFVGRIGLGCDATKDPPADVTGHMTVRSYALFERFHH